MGTRRKSRELALQFLYLQEMNPVSMQISFDEFCKHFQADKKAISYAETLANGVRENLELINNIISEKAINWRLDRISVVDRNILRLAIYELSIEKMTPSPVVIDEAIEIAKRFSTDDAGSFINGILDAIEKK